MSAADEDLPSRILVVDDDKVFCRTLASAVKRRGIESLMAHNIKDAISEIEAWKADGVIVDLRMPGENGLDLVRHLQNHNPPLRTIVLTGYGSISTAVEAVKLGAIQYLTKPVSVDEILAAFLGTSPQSDSVQAPSLDDVEWEHLQRVLKECDGNVSEAARRLSMHRRTLQRKLARGRN